MVVTEGHALINEFVVGKMLKIEKKLPPPSKKEGNYTHSHLLSKLSK